MYPLAKKPFRKTLKPFEKVVLAKLEAEAGICTPVMLVPFSKAEALEKLAKDGFLLRVNFAVARLILPIWQLNRLQATQELKGSKDEHIVILSFSCWSKDTPKEDILQRVQDLYKNLLYY